MAPYLSKFSVLNEVTFASQERHLIDPVSNGSADVLLVALTANSVKRVAYLSSPVMKLRFRVYIHRLQLNFWQSFVRPFDLGVWTLTGCVLVTGSVMLAYSYRRSRENGADHEVEPVLHRIQDAFLVTYGAMLQQGSEWTPKSCAARLVLWLSLVFGMLLYTAYSATLISSLTLQRRSYPFLSLEQLLHSPYSLCIVDQSATHTILQRARDSTVSALYRQQIENASRSLVLDILAGLQRVFESKTHAFLDVHERVQGCLGTMVCRVVDIPRDQFSTYGALGVREDLPYKFAIDYYLKRMSEGGLQKRLQRLYWWQQVACGTESIKSIRLRNVGVLFLYLLFGLFISWVTLVCERFSKIARRATGRRRVVVRTHRSIRQRKLMPRHDRSFSLPYIE
ncbi:uncharacterized protein LOC111862722 isoform X2 [Cryptotermes secundus]|uniref:uncharacterized protein LOC111862722 isoform X2 n=1 Tax=Cryptotermes secundus TaxID=105785 RepID=UPI001454D938|nr:uncharacterized protein LOC111862722 isoform X2 [Cryptotermes secundus]